MPHLTSTKPSTASTDLRTGFGIPGFAHPLVAPAERAEPTRPGTPVHWAVLNVADGPGAHPDPYCLEAAGRLRTAGFYFTDRTNRDGRTDPWETMPGYWDEIVSRIGTGVSE